MRTRKTGAAGRREFVAAGGGGVLLSLVHPTGESQVGAPATGERAYWVEVAGRLAEPVLTNLADGILKARMPVGISQRAWSGHAIPIDRPLSD